MLCKALCFSVLAFISATYVAQARRVIRAAPGAETTGSYIVVLKDNTAHSRFEAIADEVRKKSVDSKIFKVESSIAKVVAADISEKSAHEIKLMEDVEFVEEETYAYGSISWALDRIDQVSSTLDGVYDPCGAGVGVDIYILDTGINYDHCDFGGRAIYPGFDPVDSHDSTNRKGVDCNGHGSHVASIAVGTTYGVAKSATVYSVRVLRCNNTTPWSIIIDGLSKTVSHIKLKSPFRPSIISMSLTGFFSSATDTAVTNAINENIAVIAAAGNDRSDACNYTPASNTGVITVAGSDLNDQVYYYTNGGTCIDIFAPGESVIGASHTCDSCTSTCSVYKSGTSMATPIVAGAAAFLLERNPSLTPADIKKILISKSLKNYLNYSSLAPNLNLTTPNHLVHIKCPNCTALANAGDCEFYRCVEQRFQCGSNGYPLGYGYYYCREFQKQSSCFTSDGQDWISKTRACLMKAILNSNVYKTSGTCEELEKFAISSHPLCYVENGFCTDILVKFSDIVCFGSVIRISEIKIFKTTAIQQVYDTAVLCSENVIENFLDSVDIWIANAVHVVTRQMLETLKNLLGSCTSSIDIVFVLDASGSIGSANFVRMKNFTKNVISNFDIGDNGTRVGIIRYASRASIILSLGSINNANGLNTFIDSIWYTRGGTSTHSALNLLSTAFNTSRTDQGIPRVAIVFTDGQSNSRTLTAKAAQSVHDTGIIVYSIGIGSGVNTNELNTIASSSSNVFLISSFSAGDFAKILLPLRTTACTTPSLVDIGRSIANITLQKEQVRLLEYAFPCGGLTIVIDVTQGQIQVYGSFSIQNPTVLTADFSVLFTFGNNNFFVSPELYQTIASKCQTPSTNSSTSIYISLTGLQNNTVFSMNTTLGDTTPPSDSDFFVGFYESVHGGSQIRTLYVHTMDTTSAHFTITSLDGGFTYSGTTTYNNPAAVSIPFSYEVTDNNYSWRNKGLRVSSLEKKPISVVVWSYWGSASYMSYLALPCHEQPSITEYVYYVVSTYGWSNQNSQFMIIGCHGHSKVSIIPNNPITVPLNPQSSNSSNIIVNAGQTYSFVLHSLQTFFVYKPYVDLTGTKIISDKPLTIISGHELARVPAGFYDGDSIVTQLTPTVTWGKTFLLAPHYGRAGQSYKIIAIDNDTIATKTCGSSAVSERIVFDVNNTNWFYTNDRDIYCSIISDKPVYVAQIGTATYYNGSSSLLGDPCINTVPPIEQYERSIQFTAIPAVTENYYSVVMPNDAYFNKSIKINNIIHTIANWTPIYNINGFVVGYGYSAAVSGNNTLEHPSSNGKLFVSVYGWSNYGGYCYAGGMKLNLLNCPNVNCIVDPCSVNTCPNFPNARCVPDYCEGCNSRYYSNGTEVTDLCSCPSNMVLIPCTIERCLPTCQDTKPSNCEELKACRPICGCPEGTVFDEIIKSCINKDKCDRCNLPASSGPCTGTYPRWFFNVKSRQCEHFSYGGCYGNRNRFGTLQECINTCGCPVGISVQCSTNPCHKSACPSYTNAVCEVDKCTSNSTCISKYYVGFNEVTNICNSCELPASTGSCSGNETRWYYSSKSSTCQQFTYSGCGGNKNNFKTIQDCVDTCDSKCPAGVKDVYCFNDLCQVSHCPNYPEAKCVTRSCGNCTAHYYDTSGVDITALCATCPADRPPVTCLIDVCEHQNCLQFPQAQCMIDNCGSCKPKFFLNGTEITNQCSVCPVHGQIFKTCALSCRRTCTDLILHNTVICDAACKPGCECQAGQVIDETGNKCVYPQSCSCPPCQPVSPNCTNTTTPDNHLCSCPICIDCPLKGQVYKKSNVGCPHTCTSLDILCTGHTNPGCSCPDGQVVDEMKNACVPVSSCPKPNPCTLEAYKGPCNGQLQRYFHNSNSSNCEVFQYGGCYGNENNFFTKHDCEERCGECPPVCSQEFCFAKRNAICSIQSSPIQGTCQISNCLACYYSYTKLSLPVNDCTTNCVSNGQINESCVAKWGRCIRWAYYRTHSKIQPHERVASNFRCWSYPL